jgi:metal-sulfur cluster biosynthetic enzyme
MHGEGGMVDVAPTPLGGCPSPAYAADEVTGVVEPSLIVNSARVLYEWQVPAPPCRVAVPGRVVYEGVIIAAAPWPPGQPIEPR